MLSLFQTNIGFDGIRVFVLDCGIGENNRHHLEHIANQFNREITFFSMDNVKDRLQLKSGAFKISIASYARLFLASILPEDLELVLYLDCDTVVPSSLKDLWETDLGQNLIAGVQDTVDTFYKKVIGLNPHIAYVNAGILLINLKGWREEYLEQKFFDFIQKFDGNVPHHDQGTINGVCKERRTILPLRYNVMSNVYSFSASTIRKIYFLDKYYTQVEVDEAISRPVIVHFTTGLFGRPWEEGCTHPEKEYYLKIMRQSPWKEDPLLPDSKKKSVKAFAFFYKHIPLPVFETVYRLLCGIQHIRR